MQHPVEQNLAVARREAFEASLRSMLEHTDCSKRYRDRIGAILSAALYRHELAHFAQTGSYGTANSGIPRHL